MSDEKAITLQRGCTKKRMIYQGDQESFRADVQEEFSLLGQQFRLFDHEACEVPLKFLRHGDNLVIVLPDEEAPQAPATLAHGPAQAPTPAPAAQGLDEETLGGFFQRLEKSLEKTLVKSLEKTLVKNLQISTGSHGSTSFTEYYNSIQSKVITVNDFWLPPVKIPDVWSKFNSQPPDGDNEEAYQTYFPTQLKVLQKSAQGKAKRIDSQPQERLIAMDTHTEAYLDERKPDVSLFFDGDPKKNPVYVVSVGEIKPKRNGGFKHADIGQIFTMAERILKMQPFRKEVTVFLTDCHTIQFFRLTQGVENKTYAQSNQYGLRVKNGQPELGCILLSHLMWADRPTLFPTGPPLPDFKDYKVELIKYLGTGASSNVYLSSCLHRGEKDTMPSQCVVKKLVSETGTMAEVTILRLFNEKQIQHVPILKDFTESMLLLQPVAEHFTSKNTLFRTHIHQVIAVLQQAHENGLIHRDIRPDNIMWLSEKEVLVNDWGFAVSSEKAVPYKGTLHFAGDEVLDSLKNQKEHKSIPQDDMQSFVRTAFALCFPRSVDSLYQQKDPDSIKTFWQSAFDSDLWKECCSAASMLQYEKLDSLFQFLPQ